jgi:hypothetical protein
MKRLFARRQAQSHFPDGRSFRYPLDPCPKVTVICDTLHAPGCTHVAESAWVDPHDLRTETLAAPASLLLDLPDGWMPQLPLVAFTGSRHGFLDVSDRERLWRRFGVPVFEQLIDDDGRIFASECEAHEGLHIDDWVSHTLTDGEVVVNGSPSGVAARQIAGLCGCGRIGPRLLDVRTAMRVLSAFGV